MIYAYCIRREDDPAPREGLAGVGGAAVALHRHGPLSVWTSEIVEAPVPSEDSLRAHERVVREALLTSTPMPLRFGTVFPSESLMARSLEEHGDRLERMLHRVDGLVEMGIRVEQGAAGTAFPKEEAPREADRGTLSQSGRAYLERRRSEIDAAAAARSDAEKMLDAVRSIVGELAVESTRNVVLREGVLGHVACLVRRADISRFRVHVTASLVPAYPDRMFFVSGPWAPYSFADE